MVHAGIAQEKKIHLKTVTATDDSTLTSVKYRRFYIEKRTSQSQFVFVFRFSLWTHWHRISTSSFCSVGLVVIFWICLSGCYLLVSWCLLGFVVVLICLGGVGGNKRRVQQVWPIIKMKPCCITKKETIAVVVIQTFNRLAELKIATASKEVLELAKSLGISRRSKLEESRLSQKSLKTSSFLGATV